MVKAELKEMRSVLIQVDKGKCPRFSIARRSLRKAGAIKLNLKKKGFGISSCSLTPKGRRFLKALK